MRPRGVVSIGCCWDREWWLCDSAPSGTIAIDLQALAMTWKGVKMKQCRACKLRSGRESERVSFEPIAWHFEIAMAFRFIPIRPFFSFCEFVIAGLSNPSTISRRLRSLEGLRG